MLALRADKALQVLRAVFRREVGRLPGDEGLGCRVAEMPRLGPQGSQGVAEDVAYLVGDQVPQGDEETNMPPVAAFLRSSEPLDSASWKACPMRFL